MLLFQLTTTHIDPVTGKEQKRTRRLQTEDIVVDDTNLTDSTNSSNSTNSTENNKTESDFYYPFEAYNYTDTRAKSRTDVVYFDTSSMKFLEGEEMFSAFPSMMFDDNVYVMGDYFSTDYTELKAYTELEIKIDFFKVIEEALKRTHLWKSEAEKATGLFLW